MNDKHEPAGISSINEARSETKKISSRILDIAAVKGEVSEPGPNVSNCEEETDRTFRMFHPWSVSSSSSTGLASAMVRLKNTLPNEGWKIVKYGRNSSKNRSLELTADHPEKKFSVNVAFWREEEDDAEQPKLIVTVVSACYEVPEGEEVDQY